MKPCGRAGCLCTASSTQLLGEDRNQTALKGSDSSALVKGLGILQTAEDMRGGSTVFGSTKPVGGEIPKW